MRFFIWGEIPNAERFHQVNYTTQFNRKEVIMENGSIGADTAAVLALLTDTARAGRGGYGYGGGEGGYGHGLFAGPSSNAVRIDRNADTNREQHENILRAVSNTDAVIRDQSINNRLNAQDRQLCDLSKELATCCCENKTAIAASESRLTGLIKDTTIEQLKSDLAEARAAVRQNGGPPGPPPK
jgi:hypothetical protein